MDYFIISQGKDGISIEGPLVGEQIQSWIQKNTEGVAEAYQPTFLDTLPDKVDKGYWMTNALRPVVIIGGQIIVPE